MVRFALVLLVAAAAFLKLRAQEWNNGEGYRWQALTVGREGKIGFTLLDGTQTGVQFTNVLSEWSMASNRVLQNGSGIAIGDYDQDGKLDLFFAALESSPALYRNLGDWKFENVFPSLGITPGKHLTGAVFADIDGDTWLDLLLTRTGQGVLCYLNTGDGKFIDATARSGFKEEPGATTLAVADIDRDGDLDIYVAKYRPDDIRDKGRANFRMVNGRPILSAREPERFNMRNGRVAEHGMADALYINEGKGKFSRASWMDGRFSDENGAALKEPFYDWGLSASFRDVNGDGAPDLYVCNDYWTPDRFWLNDGKGNFRLIAPEKFRKMSASSMGVDFADVDRDGDVDFFVVDMLSRDRRLRKRQSFADPVMSARAGMQPGQPQVMRNTFYINHGGAWFSEAAEFAGLTASDWSWGPIFLDVDLDGFEDLLISAGHYKDVQDMDANALIRSRQHSWDNIKSEEERQRLFTQELMEHQRLYPPLKMPIVTFRNHGNWKFSEKTSSWGLEALAVHHGMAVGDLDGDGDQDLVVNNLNGNAGLYRNGTVSPRVAVRLSGAPANVQGIGAKVTLSEGAVPEQASEVVCGGRYLSGSSAMLTFAAAGRPMRLEVRWPDGKKSVISPVRSNCLYEVQYASASQAKAEEEDHVMTYFQDESIQLSHEHIENVFDDYARQPLLPMQWSAQGPAVAWADIDGDAQDELAVGAAAGGAIAIFRQTLGRWTNIGASLPPVRADVTAIIQDVTEPGALLVGLSGYEQPQSNSIIRLRFDENGARQEPLPVQMQNTGALAIGALNGAGPMALFVGGGLQPGAYPRGAPSQIFIKQGADWSLDRANSAPLSNLGIVNGAVWSDLDGDGFAELILACEWGPVRVYRNRAGRLFEATQALGLGAYSGWWKSVATGDFNNDGRQDIVAANWGLNSPYAASHQEPLVFFHGQLATPGVHDVVETEYVRGQLAFRKQFAPMAAALPFLAENFQSHKAYSEATADQLLGDRRVLAQSARATTLASMVFTNNGNGFNARELPREAQLAPAFSAQAGDFDGDGNEDIFLSQNFSFVTMESGSLDAGFGLWLQGDGRGIFNAVPPERSGVRVSGDQRGAALGDFNQDGRVDLAIGQNSGGTKLYRNVGAEPAVRVRLKGPAGNPFGVGAAIRLQFGDSVAGPGREIQAGSGWQSQNSVAQLLAAPHVPTAVRVRWPGGKVTVTPLPEGTRDATIALDGTLAR